MFPVAHSSSPLTTYFMVDENGLPLVEETYNGTTAAITLAHGVGADGEREQYVPSGLVYYAFAYDPEGNVVWRDTSGNSTSRAVSVELYDAYGSVLYDKRTSDGHDATHHDPIGFAGQWGGYTDFEVTIANAGITSPILMTHRHYDPRTGRFLNRDPIGYQGGINLYGYAANNPITNSDPSGFDGENDPWQYLGNAFAQSTPSQWWKMAKENDVTKAVGAFFNLLSYVPGPENPAFDLKAASLAKAIIVDNNILVDAFKGRTAAVDVMKNAGEIFITPNQYHEFMDVKFGKAAHAAFLKLHNVKVFSNGFAESMAKTPEFQQVFQSVAKDHGRDDAALVAFARVTGITAITGEKRLVNYVNISNGLTRKMGIPIVRVIVPK